MEEDQQRPEPPARVAARFYRPSRHRRRSSAHSSRRSSISSSRHSRTSALSSHGGPYSTHIAQHLRRASIIEDRKARLAERAAHAEQVRLRAAAARAIPRISNTEERALAAQAAKEKLLADIAARCEEEVKRAKRIAEETKEKRAAEHAKLVEEMEEKYANAARRRSIYQSTIRRPRTTSLAAVEEKKLDRRELKALTKTAAAKIIQKAWRSSRTRSACRQFANTEIKVEKLAHIDFDQVGKLISEESVIRSTLSLLNVLGLLDGESDDTARRGATRVFLSAFMIAAHPVVAFSHGGSQPKEQEVLGKAQNLTQAIHATVTATLARQASIYNKESLQFLLHDFTSTFHAWKTEDLTIIADVLLGSFVNLDAIVQATKNDQAGNTADDYLAAVRTEQTKILVRLKRLLDPEPALSKVRAAVRKARKARAAAAAAAATPSSSDGLNVPRANTPTDMDFDISASAILTTPPLPPPSAAAAPFAAVTNVDGLPSPPATPAPSARHHHDDASALVQLLGRSMTVLPPNREIAHEIQINGTFEIEQQPWTDSRKALTDGWRSSMRRCIEIGGKAEEAQWVGAMVTLIRGKLLSLITERHTLHSKISDFLDPDLLARQSYHSSLDYKDFFGQVAEIISQLCSPGRDQAVRDFQAAEQEDLIDRLFRLIDILDLMALDHVNFEFRMASRQVVEHGHLHEHAMFERDLQDRVHDLTQTRRWWRNARANVVMTTTTTTSRPNNGNLANAIYARGLTDLVLSNKSLSFEDFPETLRLDYLRLQGIRSHIFQIVCVASVLLSTKLRLRRNREALWSRDVERMMKLDFSNVDESRVLAVIVSNHLMPENTRAGLIDFIARVVPPARAAAAKTKQLTDDRQTAIQSHLIFEAAKSTARQITDDEFSEQVAVFILKSLREHIYSRLSTSSAAEKARVTSSASEVLARIGAPEFVDEVGKVVESLEKVKAVDLRAHEEWYDQVAADTSV